MFLRSEKLEKERLDYVESHQYTDCFFCSNRPKLKQEFKFWRIVQNDFPYDVIAQTHDILALKRHIQKESDLTKEEQEEFLKIKQETVPSLSYHAILENVPKEQSVPNHFHVHLIEFKRE